MIQTRDDLIDFDSHAAQLRAQGASFAIATVVRTLDATSAKPGDKALILDDGSIAQGWIGGGCARGAITKAAKEAMADGQPKYVSLRPEELLDAEGVAAGEERQGVRFARNGCPSKGSMDIFVEPVVPSPELVVFGASPVALALVDLAQRLDFVVTLCAPDLDGAPAAHNLRSSFDLNDQSRANRYVIVATQGKTDQMALRAALDAKPRYVAFVGSTRKYQTLSDRLRADGMSQETLDAVSAPAGLHINAITPDEIALSILAEITQLRRDRQRQRSGED